MFRSRIRSRSKYWFRSITSYDDHDYNEFMAIMNNHNLLIFLVQIRI